MNLFQDSCKFLFLLIFSRGECAEDAQQDCLKAPTPALRMICEQIVKWDRNVRTIDTASATGGEAIKPPAIPGLLTPLIAAELAPVAATPSQCMNLGCLCSYMGGRGQQDSNECTLANGRPLLKAIRKEYRMMSDDERMRFHEAMRSLKNSGEYDRIAALHSQFATSGSAHSGPGFLPWHREFLKRVEISLRQVDPSVAIPYWDSTLDSALSNARHSIMWLPEFMGDTDRQGNVVSGDFANWRTLAGRQNVLRSVGSQGKLFSPDEIQSVLRQTSIRRILAFTVPRAGCDERINWGDIEYTHGNVHIYLGGDMLDQSTAANDPIFFLHHSFVDMIWEMWREMQQNRDNRETDYPTDNQFCSTSQHFASALMRPFEPWQNIDGLSNKYTDNMYEYAPRPNCGLGPTCGSKYLFCDRSSAGPRCVAKVRPGGICSGFISENVCYRGVCQNGQCVETQQNPSLREVPTQSIVPQQQRRQNVIESDQVACYNENECCSLWAAAGECDKNPAYMKVWCKASCRQCRPNYDESAECSNRHRNCEFWARVGECERNANWMHENCRLSCNSCNITRREACTSERFVESTRINFIRPNADANWRSANGTTAILATTATSNNKNIATIGDVCGDSTSTCHNENICCQVWSTRNECSLNPAWMRCNCRASCKRCSPQGFTPGNCGNYHPFCQRWALMGECSRNMWMLENCRLSCGACFTASELSVLCSPRMRARESSVVEVQNVLAFAARRRAALRRMQLLRHFRNNKWTAANFKIL